MSLTLQRLTLLNFKGHREYVLEPQSRDLDVFGANESGKTTLADAWFWLLFGKDSQNRADFEVKTLSSGGEAMHHADHSVEAELLTSSGPISLRRVYHEVWTQKRGSSGRDFTGHETDYFVCGVPVQKKEYQAQVAALCDEERFRLLTDPTYFNLRLTWQDRRKMLLIVCGDVTDAEVIALNDKLAGLPAILGQHSIDNYRKIAEARKRTINEELASIRPRIDEVMRGLPEEVGVPKSSFEAAIDRARSGIQAIEERRAQASAGGTVADLTVRLRQAEAELVRLESEALSGASTARAESQREWQGVNDRLVSAAAKVQQLARERADLDDRIARADRKIGGLLADYKAEEARGYTGAESCPACGQALPAEKIASATEEFNLSRSKRLAQIIEDGKAAKAEKATLTEQLERHGEVTLAAIELRDKISAELNAIVIPEVGSVDLPAVPAYAEALAARDDLARQIQLAREGSSSALALIDEELGAARASLAEAEKMLASADQHEAGLRRIAELEESEKTLAGEYEELGRHLWLTEEFIRTKVSMLTDRINGRFRLASFKLFETQVNGGIAECCEVTYKGVPYGSLNSAARINVGLDIINTLAEHFGIAPPVFIDGAESVTDILPTVGQQVRLTVSAKDKSLRVIAHEHKELIAA